MPAVADDAVVAQVTRVVQPESLAPAVGTSIPDAGRATAFGLTREPEPDIDRVDGHLFLHVHQPAHVGSPTFVTMNVPDRRPGEAAFVVVRTGDADWRYAGVGRWREGGWVIPELDFESWRAVTGGRGASRELEPAWHAAAVVVVEDLLTRLAPGGWVGRDGKRCRLVGRAAQGGLRIDGGEGGFGERTVSLADIGWVLAARAQLTDGEFADEARVNHARYLAGTPKGSTRWVDTGWALVLVAESLASSKVV